MFFDRGGFGVHTAMSSSPFGASMINYTGYRNSNYNHIELFPQHTQIMNPFGMDMPFDPIGGGHHHHNCEDDGLDKAILIGGASGLAVGLVITFAKPIWNGICAAGKAIASAAKWCWNGITGLFHKNNNVEATEKTATTVAEPQNGTEVEEE